MVLPLRGIQYGPRVGVMAGPGGFICARHDPNLKRGLFGDQQSVRPSQELCANLDKVGSQVMDALWGGFEPQL